jgi:hypothetical protein
MLPVPHGDDYRQPTVNESFEVGLLEAIGASNKTNIGCEREADRLLQGAHPTQPFEHGGSALPARESASALPARESAAHLLAELQFVKGGGNTGSQGRAPFLFGGSAKSLSGIGMPEKASMMQNDAPFERD